MHSPAQGADSKRPLKAYLDHDRLMDCVHCGLCLSQCPTYAEESLEADSPRGRIYLMRALAEGRSKPTPNLVEHLDLCLGCRACETACPSGVQYGLLLEGTRHFLHDNYRRPWKQRMAHRVVEAVFPQPARLEAALLPVRVLRRTGLMSLLRATGLLKLLGPLDDMERLLPPLPHPRRRKQFLPRRPAQRPQQVRVAMVTGCVMQVLQPEVNEATARVLARAGCAVEAPHDQGCCGALHAHSGNMNEARRLARWNIGVFEKVGSLDAIIINAAGCGSALKEYGGWLRDDPEWAPRAAAFAAKVRDVSEFLAAAPFRERLAGLMKPAHGHVAAVMNDVPREVVPNTAGAATLEAQPAHWQASEADRVQAIDDAAFHPQSRLPRPNRATYHDACHLAHGQGIRVEPRSLLQAVPGLELVSLQESEMCCGSAGTYNITQPGMSRQLLKRKMKHIAATGARIVITGNPGCAMQIRLGSQKFGVPVQVKHPVQVLDEATRE